MSAELAENAITFDDYEKEYLERYEKGETKKVSTVKKSETIEPDISEQNEPEQTEDKQIEFNPDNSPGAMPKGWNPPAQTNTVNVEKTVEKIISKLSIKNLDWVLSYQSRVGPLKWIGPSTEDVIIENSKLGKKIVLVPIAFVSEHSETLVELDIEYKELAEKNGCIDYIRVPALGTNKDFINSLSSLVIKKEERIFSEDLYPPKIQCPSQFKKCPCL